MVYIPSETLLEKINFSFASVCQLLIASWLGTAALAHFRLSVLRPHLPSVSAVPTPAVTVSAGS